MERYSNGKLKPTEAQKVRKNAISKLRYSGSARESVLAKQAKYRSDFPERRKASQKKYEEANREKINARHRAKYQSRKPKIEAYRKSIQPRINERNRIRKETDLNFRIKTNLSTRISAAVRTNKTGKAAKTSALVGCEMELLKLWLESKFKEGMTWENYGEWHIDHKIPCAEFDLRDEAQQRTCFHYSNLQPLWASENCSKGRKLTFTK